MVRSAEVDYTGIINVGTGKSRSFRQLLKIVKDNFNTNLEPIFIPKEANYVENLEADTKLMKEILGIEPMSPKKELKNLLIT